MENHVSTDPEFAFLELIYLHAATNDYNTVCADGAVSNGCPSAGGRLNDGTSLPGILHSQQGGGKTPHTRLKGFWDTLL